jgi:hypothetical protein
MNKKQKVAAVSPTIVESIRRDFSSNGINLYRIEDIPEQLIGPGLFAQGALEKSTTAFVALSGSADPACDYILMGLLRKDVEKGKIVTDIDPIMLAYDTANDASFTGSLQTFHGHDDFHGRTQLLPFTVDTSLEALRSTVVTTGSLFEQADERYTNAMHFMATRFNDVFLDGGKS